MVLTTVFDGFLLNKKGIKVFMSQLSHKRFVIIIAATNIVAYILIFYLFFLFSYFAFRIPQIKHKVDYALITFVIL